MALDPWLDPVSLLLAAAFAGGVAAGALSAGGARAGAVSGFVAGIFGFGVLATLLIARVATDVYLAPASDHFAAGFAPIILPFAGAVTLLVALSGGAIGALVAGFLRLSRPPIEPATNAEGGPESEAE